MKLRIIVAAAVLVSGAVHLKLWADGFRDISVIGPLFLLNAVAALVIAGAVLRWRNWPPLLVAVGFGASTLGAFVISATVGLFGVHEVWNRGGYAVTANVSELVALVVGSWALYTEGWAAKARSRVPIRQTAASRRAGHHPV
jgi:hypothetical protein